MKRLFFCLCLFLLCTSCKKQELLVSNIQATSYIVMNQDDLSVLEGNNYHEVRSVASISKMMTAIVTIENCDLYQYTIVPDEVLKTEGSSIYLKPGEKIQVIDLLYGLMLRSGNDAAITLALTVAGTIDVFVEMMNEKASQINMNHTMFSNPTGLDVDDSGNLSTAYDMALLHAYCLQNQLYAQIVSTKQYKNYTNKNKLLQQYEYCTGGKTGFTKLARRTLVSSASKDDLNLIIVTLNCGNDFESHKNFYEYYFSHYLAIIAVPKGYNYFDQEEIYVDRNYFFMIKKDKYKNLYLLYEINHNKRQIVVYLYDDDKNCIDQKTIIY